MVEPYSQTCVVSVIVLSIDLEKQIRTYELLNLNWEDSTTRLDKHFGHAV